MLHMGIKEEQQPNLPKILLFPCNTFVLDTYSLGENEYICIETGGKDEFVHNKTK